MSALNVAEERSVALPERAALQQHATRPFLWLVRRELWENPSIVVAPVAVAAVIVFGFFVAAIRFSGKVFISVNQDPVGAIAVAMIPLFFVAFALGITMLFTGVFYSLDALHSERRDRSILFWKSLPVSDRETVLSKLTVPMAVLPIVTFAVALSAQILIFLIENGAMLAHGGSLRALWTQLPIPAALTAFLYGLITTTLWYAPIYAWLMLVSAWARRAALIWAVVPFFILAIFEKIAFRTHYVVDLVKYRISGGFLAAFAQDPGLHQNRATVPLSDLTPAHFFASPGLWTGLVFAALVVVLLIRMRRYREPI